MTYNTKVRLPQGGDRLEVDAANGGAITPATGIQAGAIADVSGGSTVDAEARTALNNLLAALRAVGIIASS